MSPYVHPESASTSGPTRGRQVRRRGWRYRRLDNSVSETDGHAGFWALREVVSGAFFAVGVIAAGFAYFSLWVVIPTLVLLVALVVWWARGSRSSRDARRAFREQHPRMGAPRASASSPDAPGPTANASEAT